MAISLLNCAGPVPNTATDMFNDFDDEHGHNILGNLQLESDEEPVRRGASRANSVRFDVSASQGGGWAQASRNSGEFGPVRPNSGIGGHPMTERAQSHRSDGRHSSAGHSIHSGRASSLGLDTNFHIGPHEDDILQDVPAPPPGLYILGPAPSIIRCWLSNDFSHNSLLFAVVCPGSYKSLVEYQLVKELGLLDHIQKTPHGRSEIRLPVFLPEAAVTNPTSRPNSPAPQVPSLTWTFEVTGASQRSSQDRRKAIRIFMGSDVLRLHNADLLLSQNIMTIYGDDHRTKLSIPFVRPEDDSMFRNLCITNQVPELKATAVPFTPTDQRAIIARSDSRDTKGALKDTATAEQTKASSTPAQKSSSETSPTEANHTLSGRSNNGSTPPSENPPNESANGVEKSQVRESSAGKAGEAIHSRAASTTGSTEISDRRDSTSGIWGSWRQNNSTTPADSGASSSYNKPSRGGAKGMKVLKPKLLATGPSRSPSSGARTGASYEPPAPRSAVEGKGRSGTVGADSAPGGAGALKWEPRRSLSSNPVGSASAFAWMNSQGGKAKSSATAAGE